MAMPNPAPDLYDEEEWEMLAAFEQGEWNPVPNEEAELARHQELFRAVRAAGNYGPVDHDAPYPWSKRADAENASQPLAGNDASGDNRAQTDS